MNALVGALPEGKAENYPMPNAPSSVKRISRFEQSYSLGKEPLSGIIVIVSFLSVSLDALGVGYPMEMLALLHQFLV